jgi:hypothetical protein
MKRQSPEQRGLATGSALPAVGRAQRNGCGEGKEIWRLPGHDEALAKRLLSLGQAGAGGFVDAGVDAEGLWLLRAIPGVLLRDELRSRRGPWPFREAVTLVMRVARALAACEKASLFAGPLGPDAIWVDDDRIVLPAQALVTALVGAVETAAGRDSAEISPLWTPPAQADGAVWDSEANRYVLGLLLYRLLSGEHPFSGAGLRHALGEAAHREAPPFVDAIAAELPSGLQSLALRLLDPDPARRSSRSEAIAADLERFLHDGAGLAAKGAPGAARPRATAAERTGSATGGTGAHRVATSATKEPDRTGAGSSRPVPKAPRSTWGAVLAGYWPIGAGLLIALGAVSLLGPAAPPPPKIIAVAPASPLADGQTTAEDCAACHGRQAAEWRRSVMAHAVKSPLFNALESLIEEQVGRDFDCPNGAGILRKVDPSTACRDRTSGVAVTGSGGEHWCVNCHSPAEKLGGPLPAWDGRPGGDPRTRQPVRDLLSTQAIEGISCGFCHQVHGPVGPRGSRGYQGNPTWTSFATGAVFLARPEDGRGLFGIANSGYDLRPESLLIRGARNGFASPAALPTELSGAPDPVVHLRPSSSTAAYLRSSEFCGSCHDVRLFGTDVLGVERGEHFKRLRNAYSEWAAWAKDEARAGRPVSSCQDCHMSAFPGVCEPAGEGSADPECPPGMRFVARAPGQRPRGRVADNSPESGDVSTHYFSGVDVPLAKEFADAIVDEPTVDTHGIPLSALRRRDILLRHTFRFDVEGARRGGSGIEIPIEVENIGAGHRVPAGFSQEREFWVHLVVKDGSGRILYEVGRVDRGDEDLHDKVFSRVNTRPDVLDAQGRPEGLFGADVRDGPDVPRWDPPPELGGRSFRGRGLINFQNGFLRCVRCIGFISADGRCEPGPGQGTFRADRFDDAPYDQDTGECRSNLGGTNALFETYFPVGALDASRGIAKGPDAIIDTRSVPPNVPLRYTYDLPLNGRRGPLQIEARLLFRAFPPFLVRAFAAYEREQARRGLRPSGPLVTDDMLERLQVVELARRSIEVR